MTLIEKWKVSPDQKGIGISKSLDTINHSKLPVKPLSTCKGQYKVKLLDRIDSSGTSWYRI